MTSVQSASEGLKKPVKTALIVPSGSHEDCHDQQDEKQQPNVQLDGLSSSGEEDNDLVLETPAPLAEPECPGGIQLIMVMVAIILAIFLMALDRTIIATAVPQITNEFHSLDDIGWYGSAFMLTSAGFQLPLGKLYTFYSPKWIFLGVIGIFEVGSLLCGVAPNSIAFIIGRTIAGIGSAGIMSGGMILMVNVLPLHKRPLYQGFIGAAFGVSSVMGPLVGGAFTTNVSWRWCFYINLPIGGAAMLAIFFLLKPTAPAQPGLTVRQKLAQLDLLGELFLLPSIICLLLALQWGGAAYGWKDGRVVALFVVFGVTLILFVAVQVWKPETATIPARIVKERSVISGMFFVFCVACTMMTLVFYIPIWFQAVKGLSAVQSGIHTLPLVIAMVVGSILSGAIVSRTGYYAPVAMASSVLMPIAAGLIYTWSIETPTGSWIGYQILFGLGTGLGMQQGTMAAQTVLPRKDVPTGISLMFFVQQIGGAIFVSVGQSVFNSSLIRGLVGLVQDLDPAAVVHTGATDIRKLVPPADLGQVLVVYNDALRCVFLIAVVTASFAALGAFSLEWRSVKGKQGPSGPVTIDKTDEKV